MIKSTVSKVIFHNIQPDQIEANLNISSLYTTKGVTPFFQFNQQTGKFAPTGFIAYRIEAFKSHSFLLKLLLIDL